MILRLHPHAAERAAERGADETEIRAAIERGETFPAKHGRTGFRRTFPGPWDWRSRTFDNKQVEVYAVEEDGGWLAITDDRASLPRSAMQITHDPSANVAYIRLRESRGPVETLRITSDFLVDLDETGAVCGIELLNANEQLVAGDDGRVTFSNTASGVSGEWRVG